MIKKTTEYDKFGRVKGNRILRQYHVRNLIKSIAEKNLLPVNPIIVNKENDIIDGQHRLAAAKHLSLPIYYAVTEESVSIADVIALNANNERWTLLDFIDSYIEMGYEDYMTLRKFYEKYQLKPSVAVSVLSLDEERATLPAYKSQIVRSGDFGVENMDESIKFMESIDRLERFLDYSVKNHKPFLQTFRNLTHAKGWHIDDIEEALSQYGQKFMRRMRIIDYYRQWEDVLRRKSKNISLY